MNGWPFVFWCALAFVAYTYVGYPLVIWLLSRLRNGEAVAYDPKEWPAVTVVIAVHNDRERAVRKVANLRALDYPADKLSILFACDGCTDGTVAALAAEPGVQVLDCPSRQGKPQTLNQAVLQVVTPVILFADARQAIDSRALKALVSRLMQPAVGAVTGELAHKDPVTHTAEHLGLYWHYENWIRLSEGRFASTIGVTGALYAMRREHYTELPADTLLDDLLQAMCVVRKGLRVVLDPLAIVYDEAQKDVAGERRRKIRTLTGNFQAFVRHPWLLSPFHNRLWVQFVSHKVCRLVVPYALAVLFASSLFSSGWIYSTALGVQLAFYAAALCGVFSTSLRSTRLVSFATLFVELNWAAVIGLRNFLRGGADSRWERT